MGRMLVGFYTIQFTESTKPSCLCVDRLTDKAIIGMSESTNNDAGYNNFNATTATICTKESIEN